MRRQQRREEQRQQERATTPEHRRRRHEERELNAIPEENYAIAPAMHPVTPNRVENY